MLARAEPSRCPCCRQELPTFEKYGITIRGDIGAVTRNGQRATLTPAMLMVFECLVDSYPKAASTTGIFDVMYSDQDDQPRKHIVLVYISHLRTRLGPLGMTIVNHFGFGYRLVIDGEKPAAARSQSTRN